MVHHPLLVFYPGKICIYMARYIFTIAYFLRKGKKKCGLGIRVPGGAFFKMKEGSSRE